MLTTDDVAAGLSIWRHPLFFVPCASTRRMKEFDTQARHMEAVMRPDSKPVWAEVSDTIEEVLPRAGVQTMARYRE